MSYCPFGLPNFRFDAPNSILKLSGSFYLPRGPELLQRMGDLIELNQVKNLQLEVCFNKLDSASQTQLLEVLALLQKRKIPTQFRWLYFVGKGGEELINDPRFYQFPLIKVTAEEVTTERCDLCKSFAVTDLCDSAGF
ncbi:MAG: hypothetical protein A2527_12705 [Candidatus Lambdaproteobacteria bacterium RIFOXYD2_FULL_50_16]|uniref:Uncharacterized protein n=1 Tax=Candidatus Lambdaproteobacteria bacterium RIFOXYD2_FULL_50_16 TaxID=1817772 RepID=A0A1F6GA84_9PROT|nr:MAG: hypothetical protein A2527_12705 [Candidatus Lambdaproteobacteria bacterium RIFOXYD2_FULL_50_16]